MLNKNSRDGEASPLMLYHQMNPEFDEPIQLRKNSSLVMGRDRTDSISAFKKYDKSMVHQGNLNINHDFDSPHMSPMLTSTAIGGNYGGMMHGLGVNNF